MHNSVSVSQPPSSISQRLLTLRSVMRARSIDAVVIPSSDPHLSEYLPERWKAREYLSGFRGSVGTLVVTRDHACLWTDSRYWEQAAHELVSDIALMKQGLPGAPAFETWLADNVAAQGCVAVDGDVLSVSSERRLVLALQSNDIRLDSGCDLVDLVWTERAGLPCAAIYAQAVEKAGESRMDKLQRLRAYMELNDASWCFLSSLDEIAWLLNLRGSDVLFNPVFLAHALVGPRHVRLFVGKNKISHELRAQLVFEGVHIEPYGRAAKALASLAADETLLIDPDRVTKGLISAVDDNVKLLEMPSPVMLFKSRKNAREIESIREVMVHDGVALCEFFAWFDAHIGKERITELTVERRLQEERARCPDFISPSFATIAGFNANGALPHYHADAAHHAVIEGNGLLLIDSGGQYRGGTTDITRMLAIGSPSAAQKRDCARVLKGLIALSRAHFPGGVPAAMLDAIARAPLWAEGIDYGHGTGHGVGCFLNVHEGPQSIAYRAQPLPQTAMQPGMITSIEPGLYRAGRWGVRFENLVLNCISYDGEFGQFLAFETLTLCPIDTRCIDLQLLRPDERAWLDGYHAEVQRRLAPSLSGQALDWLLARTVPTSAGL